MKNAKKFSIIIICTFICIVVMALMYQAYQRSLQSYVDVNKDFARTFDIHRYDETEEYDLLRYEFDPNTKQWTKTDTYEVILSSDTGNDFYIQLADSEMYEIDVVVGDPQYQVSKTIAQSVNQMGILQTGYSQETEKRVFDVGDEYILVTYYYGSGVRVPTNYQSMMLYTDYYGITIVYTLQRKS